ncbi:Hok/Gef family protein [Fulvivirga sp. 29W222]|uniref:Hok/Gef family protein n=1 Tax=Fulvivirga marina TaxID=2494733 RepID=A0A937G098_9BACT|nr:Hok/Gef family protein [Fulvivirga marina]
MSKQTIICNTIVCEFTEFIKKDLCELRI